MVGEGEIRAQDGGGIDVGRDGDVDGIDDGTNDLSRVVVVDDGCGIVVVVCFVCFADVGFRLFPDEVKRDDSGCGGDGGGNGVVGHHARKNGVNHTKIKKPRLTGRGCGLSGRPAWSAQLEWSVGVNVESRWCMFG